MLLVPSDPDSRQPAKRLKPHAALAPRFITASRPARTTLQSPGEEAIVRRLPDRILAAALLLACFIPAPHTHAQPAYDYDSPFLTTSQLGFHPQSVKRIVLMPGKQEKNLPDRIPFYITRVGERLSRKTAAPGIWQKTIFRWPFDISSGDYLEWDPAHPPFLHEGVLVKSETRWGTLWLGDFSRFTAAGLYQAESTCGSTVPFVIEETVYDRLDRGYLEFIYCQRSGTEIPGVRPEENADDARKMSDPDYYMPVAGGWNDAGDWRKWLFLTLGNLEALADICRHGHRAFREQALAEIRWGNAYFHNMVNDSGFVYEDTGGGFNRAKGMDESWWNENHPGVNAGGDLASDNIPMNGNERSVRNQYNPLVQYKFVRYQALCSTVMPGPDQSNCRVLAERAWRYGQGHPHDERTLFVSEELLAALELLQAGSRQVDPSRLERLVEILLERQEIHPSGLSGYFMEKGHSDGYRSIAFPAEPALALLRMLEVKPEGLKRYRPQTEAAVRAYVDDYLLRDAGSNPFGIPPYGIYVDPLYPKEQTFRDAGNNRRVRTFIHVFHERPMPHGVNANFLVQANFAARAAAYFNRKDWIDFSERILQWSTGFNTAGLCLFTGIGFKHPVPASFVNYRIPSAVSVGFLGRPDDTPYLETSNAVEWSTQEIWDIPYLNTIKLIHRIGAFRRTP